MSDIQSLIKMLQSKNPDKRYDACEELRVSPSLPPEALEALQLVTNDADPYVADAAQRAIELHTISDKDALQASKGDDGEVSIDDGGCLMEQGEFNRPNPPSRELLFWWILVTTTLWTVSFVNPLETTMTTIPFILGGFAIGLAQWIIVLRRLGVSAWWIVATGLGWLVAFAIIFPFLYLAWYDNYSPGPEVYLLPLVGLVLGSTVNAWSQWLVLRRRLARSALWIPVTVIGWIIGLSAGFNSPWPWGRGFFPSASASGEYGIIVSFEMMNIGTVAGLLVSLLTAILIGQSGARTLRE